MSDLNNDQRQDEIRRGQAFINQVYQKMSRIAQEFASGEINRTQFHRLYNRYQRQIMTVAQMIAESDPTGWQEALASAETESTVHLKQRLAAKAVGISIYNNRTGMPIETIGDFSIDPELIVPMLSSYREAAAEIFHAGVRSTEMENGQWLCFMAGAYTTLIVLFSVEPAGNQIAMLDHLHRDFEIANAEFLEYGYTSPDQLAYPFYSFINQSNIPTDDGDYE
ncbi:MAG: hypothetical protein GYB66_06810 [Chloroflexi bacterium]|nr:hypothetical protein [Chloroflexota bacterium]